MVFLVISKSGLGEVLKFNKPETAIIWLANGLLSDSELDSLRNQGHDVTVWNYSECTNFEELPGSVAAIEEHHPGHTVWVECASSNSLQTRRP